MVVNYPNISDLSPNSTIADFLALPNSSYAFFWVWLLGAIWLIISLTLYFKEKERKSKGSLLGSMAVGCFAILFLSGLGTLVGIVTNNIMVYIIAFSVTIIVIWFFTGE